MGGVRPPGGPDQMIMMIIIVVATPKMGMRKGGELIFLDGIPGWERLNSCQYVALITQMIL